MSVLRDLLKAILWFMLVVVGCVAGFVGLLIAGVALGGLGGGALATGLWIMGLIWWVERCG